MLKGVYLKRESAKTVFEQLAGYYKSLKKCNEDRIYGFAVCTLKDVPFGPEHSCNIPVVIMFHPNMYMYVYVCDGHDGRKVKIKLSPCGIIHFGDDEIVASGPMFRDNWLAEADENGNLITKMSLLQIASYILSDESEYKLKDDIKQRLIRIC